ncbi:hypothetical protein M9434_001731 [Picochlorum sp. BPE23]|nr:hypothetical protein M9434_001731 [Picochlorum sp. BPE23]
MVIWVVVVLSMVEVATGYSTNPSVNSWRRATIYEIMTDRFNNPSGEISCANPNQYCGGTFKGIQDKIGYLKKLNMRSVWITPQFTNTPEGYHGYWPLNLFQVNPNFGMHQDMQDLLDSLKSGGLFSMLDVVLNHMGYGSAYPSFNYYFNPFNQESQFHSCDGCLPDCSVPSSVPADPNNGSSSFWPLMWKCRLAQLPDINHTADGVVADYLNWLDYIKSEFSFDGFRYDAIPYIEPEFLTTFARNGQVFGLGEILMPGVPEGQYRLSEFYMKYGTTMISDRPDNPAGSYSQLDQMQALALRQCYGGEIVIPGAGCRFLSYVRGNYSALGLDQKLMGRYLDSADLPRFLTIYNNTVNLQSALAVLFLGEGIPVIWQGTEQGMGAEPSEYENGRDPMWIVSDFETGGELFVYIRMLNYYRNSLNLFDEDLKELWVDETTYGFMMGPVFAILPNGNATVENYEISGLTMNKEYCQLAVVPDADTMCLTTDGQGRATIRGYSYGEPQLPLIFVYSEHARPYQVFLPYEYWSILWVEGLIVSLLLLPVAWIIGHLFVRYYPHRGKLWLELRTKNALNHLNILKSKVYKNMISVQGMVEMFDPSVEQMSARQQSAELGKNATLSQSITQEIIHSKLEQHQEPGFLASLNHLGGSKLIAKYSKAFLDDPTLVWHLALEYSIPHLGLHNNLKFGGLGQVVGMFAEFTTKPLVVCAPMYSPFYDEDGNLKHDVLGATGEFVTRLPIRMQGGEDAAVNVYIAAPDVDEPTVFYILLDCYEIFGWRTKGEIYTFGSEADQLRYFAVYGQCLAALIGMFDVRCVQLHDNHAGIFLEYIKPSLRPTALITLHNADYNTKFPLGTKERNKYVYSCLGLSSMDQTTRDECEHLGNFDFLYLLVKHVTQYQGGHGFVAVSPRYAERCYIKFSRFWPIHSGKMIGVLNGFKDGDRVFEKPDNMDSLFDAKKLAKENLQKRLDLEVDDDKKVMAFFGRVTYQKGCDLVAKATPQILKMHSNAQIIIAGPIGDSNGVQTEDMMAKLETEFPGRVANLVGQYVSGKEKEELILATDFFFCPSRFEPCGLADIEMGHAGAIQIGHNTGGLNKMPGFYFEAELDSDQTLVHQLEQACLEALSQPNQVLRDLAEQAINKSFPPEIMVTAYDEEWKKLNTSRKVSNAVFKRSLSFDYEQNTDEMKFYGEWWSLENSTAVENAPEPSWNVVRAFWANILLIICQSLYRFPSLLCLIWIQFAVPAGQSTLLITNDRDEMPVFVDLFLIQLGITFFAAPIWQLIASCMSPRRYIILASWLNILSWYCSLWSFWAPAAMNVLFIISSVLGTSPVPFIGFINLDVESKVSIASQGVKLMALSDCFWYLMLVVVYSREAAGVYLHRNTLIIIGCILLVASVWLTEFFRHPRTLPPHFSFKRLRYFGQFTVLLKQRKTWLYFSLLTFFDSYIFTVLLGSILEYLGDNTDYVRGAYMGLVGTTALYSVVAAILISSRFGGTLSIKLYYIILIGPCMGLMQAALIVYCPDWAAIVAATVINVLSVRYSIKGLLSLHTMPSREIFLSVTTLQVMVGSIAVTVGAITNWKLQYNEQWLWMTVIAIAEGLRLLTCIPFIRCHAKENLARP